MLGTDLASRKALPAWAAYGDGVRAIDPQTGEVLWSLQAPEPTGPKVTAANIDGKGGDHQHIRPLGGRAGKWHRQEHQHQRQ